MIRKSKTYYVSSIRGNDKNDGLTQETPFRTLQQLKGRELGQETVFYWNGDLFLKTSICISEVKGKKKT